MYKPPHQRRAESTQAGPGTVTRPSGSSARRDAPPLRDQRDGQQKHADLDVQFLASVSRSGGYGDSGDALKDYAVQERYMAYIESVEEVRARVPLFRKLREGVVASHRVDEFALKAFGESVHCAIEAKDAPQLYAALNGLMGLYDSVDRPPNRAHFITLLLLYHLVHSPRATYQSALQSVPKGTALQFVRRAARALAPETFDSRAYFLLLKEPATTKQRKLEVTLLSWATPSVQDRAAALLRKAYMSTSVTWATALLGSEEGIKRANFPIEDGKIKLRP